MTELDIQGWFDDDFRALYQEQVDRVSAPACFVEIGCWKGKSTVGMARMIQTSGKKITFHAVDTFKGSPEQAADVAKCGGSTYPDFRRNLEACGVYDLVQAWEMTSLDFAEIAHANRFDFVFIDGDHSEGAVYADCRAWWQKVKAGGVLAGHDRGLPGVDAGVNRFTVEHNLMVVQRATVWIIQKG
jgi:SAM-dependent methyltransferase